MMIHFWISLLTCLVAGACSDSGAPLAGSDPEVRGPYLGQTPPGETPRQFAPGIITLELHSSPVFSPDGMEVFWSEMEGGGIQRMWAVDGEWTGPESPAFTLPYSGEPVYGPEGDTLYFLSGHRFEGSQDQYDENVWRVFRMEEGWSAAEPLGPPVNDHPMHWGVSLAANRNLYFGHTGDSEGIFFSEFRNGVYDEPVSLDETVNSTDMETTPCIAPDESFLVFSRVVGHGRGPIDLYVSFRNPDGSWRDAVPLTAVNTDEREISPRLSPDGQYLFFLRTVNGELMPFWVQTTVITRLRPN